VEHLKDEFFWEGFQFEIATNICGSYKYGIAVNVKNGYI
jgi:hypothetical protein